METVKTRLLFKKDLVESEINIILKDTIVASHFIYNQCRNVSQMSHIYSYKLGSHVITGSSLSFSVAFDKTSMFFQVFSLPPNRHSVRSEVQHCAIFLIHSISFDGNVALKTSVFFQVFSLPPHEKQQPIYLHVTTRILGNPSKPQGVFKGIVKEYYSYTCLVVDKS